ncbi:MAG: lactate utilization protein [Deltaproteobacteria bacterium]|nr:lactate utilization protein [Deltaproteobacteria bacterium]
MASKKLVTTMKEKAAAVQVIVSEVQNLEEAMAYAIDVTRNQGGASLAAPGWDEASRPALQAGCAQAGLALLGENLREHAGAIHTGLTRADWGIADTGTLVLDASSEDLRLATMLSETHIAVLPLSRLRATSMDLEPELNRLALAPPRYLSFITGASRTADIERVLTLGVHGPLELHLLLLKD